MIAHALALALALGVAALALELRRRCELAARATHELRGPLTAAALALHSARRAGVGGIARRAALAAVAEQLDRATLAIGDVERAAAGAGPALCRRAVDVGALLESQLAAWRSLGAARGRRVRLAAGAPELTLSADERLLRQALSNLVCNALDHGGGDVVLAARRRGGRLRLEVRDGRPGVAASPAQLERGGSRLAAGSALRRDRPWALMLRGGRSRHGHGLRLAADVAARHGGRLLLARGAGGAVAILELPLPGERRVARRRRRARSGAPTPGIRGERIPA